MKTNKDRHTVLVTGASGFIGSHVVRVLLKAGHVVHGTIRDLADDNKTSHLRALPGAERLKLFAADLQKPGSFDEACAGCDWMCHLAASVRLNANDPQREIIDPTVQGLRNVFKTAARSGTIQRAVLTSSIAAVAAEDELSDTPFVENNWNQRTNLKGSPYPLAKVLSEKAAWNFVNGLEESRRFGLVSLLPGYVFGLSLARIHIRSSPAFIHRLVTGKLLLIPRFSFASVDVEDVAMAHLRALENDQANGRYLLVEDTVWFSQIADWIRKLFPGLPVPRYQAPNLLVYLFLLFEKQMSFASGRRRLGKKVMFNSNRARKELDISFKPLEQSIIETVGGLKTLGLIG